jgi:hypothetical protein
LTLKTSRTQARNLEAETLDSSVSSPHVAFNSPSDPVGAVGATEARTQQPSSGVKVASTRLLKDWRVNYSDVFSVIAVQGLASVLLVFSVDWLLRVGSIHSSLIQSPTWYSLEVGRFGLALLGISLAVPLSLTICSQVLRSLRLRQERLAEEESQSSLLAQYVFSVESSCVISILCLTVGTILHYLFFAQDFGNLAPLSSLPFFVAVVATVLLLHDKCLQVCARRVGFTLVEKIQKVNLVQKQEQRDSLRPVELFRVRVGDVFRVSAGSVIPLDAVVVAGSAEVEERRVSGRADSVIRDRGQQVFAGSLIKTGSLDCRVLQPLAGSSICRHAEEFENLVQRALDPSFEERAFAARAVQLIWLAAAFGAFAMFLRGEGVLHVAEVTSTVLLLVLLPVVVQWVPLLRAAVLSRLYSEGSLVDSLDALYQLEEVKDVVVALPESLLEEDLPDEVCSWEFIDLEVMDERYEESSVRSVLISLLSHSPASCHNSIYQSLRVRNPEGLLYAVKMVEHHDNGCVRGQLDGAPLIFGCESFLLQHSVFIQASELEDSQISHASLGLPTIFFFAIGGEVVARVKLERRARLRGVEVGRELTQSGVRFSVVSTGDKEKIDHIGRFFGLELSQLSGGLSQAELKERVRRPEGYAVYAPESLDQESIQKCEGLVIVGPEHRGPYKGLQLLEDDPAIFRDVFRSVRAGLWVRQFLMFGSVLGSFALFLGLLFQFMSAGQVLLSAFGLLLVAFFSLYRFVRQSVVW